MSSAAASLSSSSAELVTLTAVMGYARLALATITLATITLAMPWRPARPRG
jgi:hypothetical protein